MLTNGVFNSLPFITEIAVSETSFLVRSLARELGVSP